MNLSIVHLEIECKVSEFVNSGGLLGEGNIWRMEIGWLNEDLAQATANLRSFVEPRNLQARTSLFAQGLKAYRRAASSQWR
jgi:hypothetical protein